MNNDYEKEKDLEDLMSAATEKVDENTQIEKIQSKGSSWKLITAVIVGILIIGGLIYAGTRVNSEPQEEFVDKTEEPVWEKEEPIEVEAKDQWDFDYPTEVPQWTKQPYNTDMINDEELMTLVNNWSKDIQEFNFATSWMPSGKTESTEEGEPFYTNLLEEEYTKDNEYNMYFSYVLKEDYLRTYSLAMNRLLNPVFGNWVFAQSHVDNIPAKDNKAFSRLKDMFSEEWWNANIKEGEDYSALPIMADWNGDNFGGLKLAERLPDRLGVFYGNVVNTEENKIQITTVGEGHRGHSIIKIETPVEFYAFGENDKKIKKTGMLNITLSPNSYEYDYTYRVIISDVELVIE